jgi:hypothetical protein
MKRTMMYTATILMALIAVVWLPACSDNGTDPTVPEQNGDAPELPAMSTMVFELNFFGVETPDVSAQSIETGRPGAELQTAAAANRANWINAFVRAVFVQLLMYDALEEPIGAFALAVHSVPQPQDDGSYLWTYIFVEDAVEYSIFLYGTPQADHVDWRMEVSTNNPDFLLDHFVWFEGEAMRNDRGGYWQFYDPVLDPPAMVAASPAATPGAKTARIDWQNPSATEHRLTVTVNGVGREDEGDYLEFFESSFVGTIEHYDASEGVLSNITWYPDGSGSLTVPDYNNGERACWDTQQMDTECPTS